jgi:hypothetical protein
LAEFARRRPSTASAAAGVGRSTVFTATGGKPWLLKTAYDRALAGDDELVPLAGRPEGRRALQHELLT